MLVYLDISKGFLQSGARRIFCISKFVNRTHCKSYSSRLQILSMVELVMFNIRPFESLLFMLVVIFPTRFVYSCDQLSALLRTFFLT